MQRRERHRAEVERKRRWEIRRSLADISADVELLTQEVLPRVGLPCWQGVDGDACHLLVFRCQWHRWACIKKRAHNCVHGSEVA